MNDERPIEKLLRRYAKKRGDEAGAPPELHPATRRLLQGEVARQFPKPPPESKTWAADFFSVLTRRWIYAVGVFVVLGLAAALLLPSLSRSNNRALLAQKSVTEDLAVRESVAPSATPAPELTIPPVETQPALAAASDRRDQPALAPSGAGNVSRLRDESAALNFTVTNGLAAGSLARFADAKTDTDALRKLEETKNVPLEMNLDSAARRPGTATIQSPRTAGEAPSAGSLALQRPGKAGPADTTVVTDGLSESRQTLGAPPAAATVSPIANVAAQDKAFFARGGGAEKDAGRFYSQSYANVAPEQLKAKAANAKVQTPVTPVLANFQVQQNGNELRVIDGDGSTYFGELTAIPASYGVGKEAVVSFESTGQRRTQTPTSAATATQQPTQNYLWRVEGTNRTLNQPVIFTWNFVETTNTRAASEEKSRSNALNQDASKLSLQFPSLLNNSVISGRAQLGPAQQIEVNAVPVKP